MRKYVLDSNCYIDASRDEAAWAALQRFTTGYAPGLFLSSVVAAELRAGARTATDREELEGRVLGPFVRRGRLVTPGAAAWDALGLTLATLREREGLALRQVRRGFAFDILLAYACRERGMVLVTRNTRDMARIRSVFTFEYVEPYPDGT
ncbi:MAG: type II toxin-antitoxin system VapC family toxin [Gemmatimonadetes bacterium]|nr:type II toxin-antitoxin system VapC family toxin [Gemmatimonadota bacterium]